MDTAIRDNERMKKQVLRQILARNLQAAMDKSLGLDTQKALAKKAKMGQSHISRIINGATSPSLDTLANLSEQLGIQPWELIFDAEELKQAVIERYMSGPVSPVSDERVEQHIPPVPRHENVTNIRKRPKS